MGAVVGGVLVALLLAAPGASAATITVETAFDGPPDTDLTCSLRDAVEAANTNGADANPGCEDGQASLDTIVFTGQPFAGLNGSGDDLNTVGDLDILGGALGPVRIDGSGLTMGLIFSVGTPPCPCTPNSAVIQVHSNANVTVANAELVGGDVGTGFGGTAINGGILALENATVRGGTAARGGGIWASAAATNLTLTNSEVTGNTAEDVSGGALGGGGIFYEGAGSLSVTNSLISDNHADETTGGGGGGIRYAPTAGTGSLTITNSTIAGNDTVGFSGGGIHAASSIPAVEVDVNITGSTISGNHSNGVASATGGGGGIAYGDETGKLRVLDSTFSGNTAAGSTWQAGGGIKVYDSEAAIVNSTISGNSAPASSGGGISGGAPTGGEPSTELISSTVTGNTAMDGLGVYSYDGTMTLRNTIVGNGAQGCREEVGFGAVLATAGRNVDEGTSCALNPAMGDSEGLSAGLGPLAPNGGSTLTHSIGPGSPALDRVPTASCTNDLGGALTSDQRLTGFPRPSGPACDSGAFEFQVPPPVTPSTNPPGTNPGATTPTKCKKKKKRKPRGATAAKKKRKKCGKRKRKKK